MCSQWKWNIDYPVWDIFLLIFIPLTTSNQEPELSHFPQASPRKSGLWTMLSRPHIDSWCFCILLSHLPVDLSNHLPVSHCLNFCFSVALEHFSFLSIVQSPHFVSFPLTAAARPHLRCHLRASQVWPRSTSTQRLSFHHANLASGWLWNTFLGHFNVSQGGCLFISERFQ